MRRALHTLFQRSCQVGQVKEFQGQSITLNGWIQSIRHANERLSFLLLRDHRGDCLQLVVDRQQATGVTVESSVAVRGKIVNRPHSADAMEMQVEELRVWNQAGPLPFELHPNAILPAEEIRLKHRYLDLRRPSLAANLRIRSEANQLIRQTLIADGFLEVETPLLFKATAEGAKEFLVPATRSPGLHYALPQSPQQVKSKL